MTPFRLTIPLSLLAGCSSVGAPQIYGDRLAYNEAIVQTSNEQLLLNLVRLRYRDTPFFLQVGSVSTQFSWNGSAGFGAGYDEAGGFQSGSASFGTSVSARPTVTYQPLQGDIFVKQLLSPIDLHHLVLLYHSGWSIERILLCCVQGMNSLPNAPSASGPTPDLAPEYATFAEIADAFRELQSGRGLELGTDEGRLVMRVDREAQAMRTIADRLGLPASATSIELLQGASALGERGSIAVNPRSLLGVLFFVSQAVEVPSGHELAGLVTITRAEDGSPFDWSRVLGEVIRIRSTVGERPAQASVAVRYRGAWFYIADDDLVSKSTFGLLDQLFALQGGSIEMQTPTLTLPL